MNFRFTRAIHSSFLLLGAAFFVFTSMMLVGYMAETACAGVAILLATFQFYLGYMRGYPGWTSHHVYLLLVSVSLLALSPCGRSFSLDRYRALAHGAEPRATSRRNTAICGPQRLIALQLGALYFWTAVDKTNWQFLSGQRLQEAFIWSYAGRGLRTVDTLRRAPSRAGGNRGRVEYFLALRHFCAALAGLRPADRARAACGFLSRSNGI